MSSPSTRERPPVCGHGERWPPKPDHARRNINPSALSLRSPPTGLIDQSRAPGAGHGLRQSSVASTDAPTTWSCRSRPRTQAKPMVRPAINIANNIFKMRFQFRLARPLRCRGSASVAPAPVRTDVLTTNIETRLKQPDLTLDEVKGARVSRPAEAVGKKRSRTADDVGAVDNNNDRNLMEPASAVTHRPQPA